MSSNAYVKDVEMMKKGPADQLTHEQAARILPRPGNLA
jgi:hypothetical protein